MGIEQAIEDIRKKHGKEAIWFLGDKPIDSISVIPSGNISLDIALGVGGYPRGRIVEIFGPESAGKTTVALHAIAEAQKLNGNCAFMDVEHALDPQYAASIGVDVEKLIVAQPDTGEEALDISLNLINSGDISLVVVDSVAALTPAAEIAGDIGDNHVGRQARLMAQSLRLLTGPASKNDATIIFINQLREKIGVMFGPTEVTPGGRALKFYSTLRLDVRKKESIKSGTEILGTRTQVKVVKNKVAPPFRIAEFDIEYGLGISQEGSLIDHGVSEGILNKKAAWYYWDEEQVGNGRENAKTWLKENPDKKDLLYAELMSRLD